MRPLCPLILVVFVIGESCDSSTKDVGLPSITSISPPKATYGESITISGSFLKTVDKVFFGTSNFVIPVNVSDNTVTANVPRMATGPTELWVESPDGKSEKLPFEILIPVATITSIEPLQAKRGEMITISGENLDQITTVRFNNDSSSAASFTLENNSLKVVVPQDAVTGKIWISNPEGRFPSPDLFKVLIEPQITSLSSSMGVENKGLEIRGNYLQDASVYFDSEFVNVLSNNGSVIKVKCPKFSQLKNIEIIVETVGGIARHAFSGAPAATISRAVPGGFIAGSALTLKGSHFYDVQSIVLDEGRSVDQSAFIFKKSDEITFKVPAGTSSLGLRIVNQYGVGEIMDLDPISSGNPLNPDNIASSALGPTTSSISNNTCSKYYIVFCSDVICFSFYYGDCSQGSGIQRDEQIGASHFNVFSAEYQNLKLKLEKSDSGTYTGFAIIQDGDNVYIGNKIEDSSKYVFYSTADGSEVTLCNIYKYYVCQVEEPCDCTE